jgi:glycerate 2-kinase
VPEPRDPRVTTTYGVGELVRAAIEAGATTVMLGLGGSGTNDAGAGLLAALGATAVDTEGRDVTALLAKGGDGLRGIARVDLSAARSAVEGVELVAASDVDNPLLGLRGATNGFGTQKGADDATLMWLEGSLEAFVAAVGRRPDGKDPSVALGAGAAGGLGYALLHLGARRVPGISTVLEIVDLAQQVGECDLVVTGEGAFDWQSLRGKVVSGVAEAALEQGRGCVVLAGRVEVGRREYAATGVSGAYAILDDLRDHGRPESDAFVDPALRLADLAARAARTWSR